MYLEGLTPFQGRKVAKDCQVCQVWRLVAAHEPGVLPLEVPGPGVAVVIQGLTHVILQAVAALQALADQPHHQCTKVDNLG